MSHDRFGRRDLFKRAAASSAMLGATGTALSAPIAFAQEAAPAAAKVPTQVLGATGEKIPILLMGGEFPFDPKFDKLLHRAFKEGMTYIDTAQTYSNGKSHIGVGNFQEQVGRDNLWITSKAGLWGDASASPPQRYREALEHELPILRTDHVNLFYMHGLQDIKTLEPEWIKMGQAMKKDGKTKYFGFSCHDGTVVELLNKAATIGTAGIDVIMFKYSFAQYGDLELNKAIDACHKAGIGLIAMKTQDSVPQDKEEVKKFQSQNFTLPQAKLKSVWADDRITACVSGIVNTTILKENADAAKSAVQLSMREWTQLNQYAARTADHRCAFCNHICESRVQGDLRIAEQLRYLMYAESYGDYMNARQKYAALRPEQRDFEGVDLGAAMSACPRGIDIAARLQAAKALLA